MNETIERIRKEGSEFGDKHSYSAHSMMAYAAGAISERNNTAQQAIDIFDEYVKNGSLLNFASYKQRLERLKINQ